MSRAVGLDDIDEMAIAPFSSHISTEGVPGEEITEKALEVMQNTAREGSQARLDPSRVDINPGKEVCGLIQMFEEVQNRRLLGQEGEVNKWMEITNQLLDLSKDLTGLGDKEYYELSEGMQKSFKELKAKGIDLLNGDAIKLSKEDLNQIKSTLGARVDESRTKIQQTWMKMQNIVQNLQSVNDTGKKMLEMLMNFMRVISKNMRP